MKTKGQAAQAADQAIESYERQAHELHTELRAAEAAQQTTLTHFRETIEELSRILLPQAEAEYLRKLEKATQATFLLGTRQAYEKRRPEWSRRISELEGDAEFQQRESLLTPPHGRLLVEFAQLLEQKQRVEQRLCELERSSNLVWVLKRLPEPGAKRTVFSSFWRAITLAETREQRAQAAAAKELGYAGWPDLHSDYQTHSAQVLELGNQVVVVTQRREKLQSLVAEHLDVGEWLHNFEVRLTRQLQGLLSEHLKRVDLRALHSQLVGPYQLLVAQADALKHKGIYLQNIIDFLKKEIAERSGRSEKISRVRSLWRRRSSDRLARDQSKWLIAGPRAKHESTRKQLAWLNVLRVKISQFSDYPAYSRYLAQDPQILAYDAFAFGTPERMPYEGFTLTLFPSLRQQRLSKGQKGADYSSFKQWDREERSRLRKAERDQARKNEPDDSFDNDLEDDWRQETYEPYEDEPDERDERDDSRESERGETTDAQAVAMIAGATLVGLAAAEVIQESIEAQMSEGS